MDRALSLYEQTLNWRRAKLGPDHPYTLHAMNNVAAVHLQAEDYAKAESIYRESYRLRQQRFPEDWLTFNNAAMLGVVPAKQQRYASYGRFAPQMTG